MKLSALILGGAAAMAFSVGAAEARTLQVSTQGVDMSDASDVADLHKEITKAARKACRDRGTIGLQARIAERACVREAVDTAIASANAPTLAALHNAIGERGRYSASAKRLTPETIAAVEAQAQRLAQSREEDRG